MKKPRKMAAAEALRYKYAYNANGQVAHVENTLLQHVTESEYDLSNRPSRVKTHKVTKDDAGNITSEHIYTGEVVYDDAFGRLTEFDEKVGATHTAYTTTFGYDEENRPTSLEYGSHGESTIEYDGLGRVAKTTVKAGSGAETSTTYTYVDGAALETEAPDDADDERKEAAANAAGKTSTTGLVQKIEQTGGTFVYTYDDNGNITSVVQDGVETVYTYDALGQLVRVDDGQENATWVYEYDQGGNILSKKKYALGVTSGTAAESKAFTYGNANWRDQLTAVNGVAITYDQIGNPLDDGTWTYTWQNGRQLARMQSVDVDASFVYNENRLRVQKTVNGVVTDYTLHGKNVVHMTQGSNELHFFYDAQNKPAVVVYNGTPYSYVKNLQGDIVAILDSTGTVVVQYKYDAWGRQIDCTFEAGNDAAEALSTLNPFRYRGYIFDEETGLYYLRSRYYNPHSSRFINADSIMRLYSILGVCVMTYCRNAPTCYYDASGTEEQSVICGHHHECTTSGCDGLYAGSLPPITINPYTFSKGLLVTNAEYTLVEWHYTTVKLSSKAASNIETESKELQFYADLFDIAVEAVKGEFITVQSSVYLLNRCLPSKKIPGWAGHTFGIILSIKAQRDEIRNDTIYRVANGDYTIVAALYKHPSKEQYMLWRSVTGSEDYSYLYQTTLEGVNMSSLNWWNSLSLYPVATSK